MANFFTKLQALKPDTDTINRLQDQITQAFNTTQASLASISQAIATLNSSKQYSWLFSGSNDPTGTNPQAASNGFASTSGTTDLDFGYVLPACTLTSLRVSVFVNIGGPDATITVYKNKLPTLMSVTIPAATKLVISDFTHAVTVNGTTDVISVVVGTHAGNLHFTATLGGIP